MGIFKEIATIYLHHAYFLDLGEDTFANIDVKDQKKQILENAVLSAMYIRPSLGTAVKIKNHQYKIVPIINGITILAYTEKKDVQGQEKFSPLINMEEDLKLNFEFGYHDKNFRTYSTVNSFNETPIYFIDNDALDTTSQIGNGTLLSQEATRNKVLSLAKEEDYEANRTGLYSQVRKLEKVKDTINDNIEIAKINTQINDLIDNFILNKKRHGLLGQIQLTIKGDNKDLLDMDKSDMQDIKYYTKDAFPVLTIGLANKKLHWKYIDASNEVSYTTPTTKPFTKNGHIPIKESDFDAMVDPDRNFPNARIDSPQKTENNITYTEIYI